MLHLAVKEGNVDLVRYLLRIPLPNMKDFVNLKVSPTLTRHSKVFFKYACVYVQYILYTHLTVNRLSHAAFSLSPQAHGHTALHMAAGLHGNPHQEEILRLLLSRGADPSIRNLENDQPAHLLQSGLQGEQVSCPSFYAVRSCGFSVCRFIVILNLSSFPAQAHAEETERLVSSPYRVLAGPGMI